MSAEHAGLDYAGNHGALRLVVSHRLTGGEYDVRKDYAADDGEVVIEEGYRRLYTLDCVIVTCAIYALTDVYGGGEEGGWTYPDGDLVAMAPVRTIEEAREFRDLVAERYEEGPDNCHKYAWRLHLMGSQPDTWASSEDRRWE